MGICLPIYLPTYRPISTQHRLEIHNTRVSMSTCTASQNALMIPDFIILSIQFINNNNNNNSNNIYETTTPDIQNTWQTCLHHTAPQLQLAEQSKAKQQEQIHPLIHRHRHTKSTPSPGIQNRRASLSNHPQHKQRTGITHSHYHHYPTRPLSMIFNRSVSRSTSNFDVLLAARSLIAAGGIGVSAVQGR